MAKLAKRTSVEFAIGAMLTLGSCAPGLNETQRKEVVAIASDRSGDGGSSTDLSDKVEALEARLDEVERNASALDDDIDAAEAKAQTATDQVSQLDDRLSSVEGRLGQ